MKFSGADFLQLKWSALGLLAVLAVGGAAIAASGHLAADLQRRQQQAQNQLAEARSQLASAAEDEANMTAYASEYGELLRRHIIGSEQRLEWIEALEEIRRKKLVAGFDYAISPRHPYMPPMKLERGHFALGMSDLSLRIELRHEEQLLDFFDALQSSSNGLLLLDHCALERNPDPDAPAKLKAECSGGWLTLQRENAK